MCHKKQIAVIGAARPTVRGYQMAYEAGKLLAARNCTVVCGGLAGVMEAVSKGVHDGGGFVVGIVPGERHASNPWLSAVISPGMGLARNYMIVNSADGVLAVEGGIGTLSELSFAIQLGIPVAGIDTWRLEEMPIYHASGPRDAVDQLLDRLGA